MNIASTAHTGRHHALPHSSGRWQVVRDLHAAPMAKRAPPPAEDDLDLLFYGVLCLVFLASVAV